VNKDKYIDLYLDPFLSDILTQFLIVILMGPEYVNSDHFQTLYAEELRNLPGEALHLDILIS
jgi:hypothetical protein